MTTLASSDIIAPRLEELRRKLLDLTRRNRLLNFRLARRSSVRVVDELAEEVYRILVADGKVMHFLSREEAPREARLLIEGQPAEEDAAAAEGARTALVVWTGGAVALAELPGGRVADRHKDTFLQTAMEGEALQARLTYLARESRSALEEQGCNTLYLALGMVEWQEAGAKAVRCEAPLVFVPVELKRKNVQSRYGLASFDDDIVVNPCLAELCRREFNVELPQFDADGDTDLDDFFSRVAAVIERDLKGWSFRPDIHLGLFSFAKLLMYKDLDRVSWPATRGIASHRIVQRLCGLPVQLPNEDAAVPDPAQLDSSMAPADTFQVVDADSSQTAAILAAKLGKTLVIEGPPGTGKSQTITNIIAECLASGKTVLFVAEKAAALEVVKRRLDRVGLGDFVLEMHSRFSKRRAVLDELRRALAGAEQPEARSGTTAEDLARLRTRLNDYVRELHAAQGALEASPHLAIARAVALNGAPEAVCEVGDPRSWTAEELKDAIETIDQLDRALARVGDRAAHVWRGTHVTSVGVELRQKIGVLHRELCAAIEAQAAAAEQLATAMETAPPATLEASAQLIASAAWIVDAPRVPVRVLEDERWDRLGDDVAAWIEHGVERDRRKAVWQAWFSDAAEEDFWGEVLERRRAQAGSILRFLQPSWYADDRRISRALKPGARPSIDEQLRGLKALVESTRIRATLEHELPRYRDLLGDCWAGLDGAWPALREKVRTVREAHRRAREDQLSWRVLRTAIPQGDRAPLRQLVDGCARTLTALQSALDAWCKTLDTSPRELLGADAVSVTALRDRLAPLGAAFEQLDDWAACCAAIETCRTPRLESFLRWALSPAGSAHPGCTRRAFERQFWTLFADHALAACAMLRAFRGDDHSALIERFRKADVEWIRATRRRLVQKMRQSQPNLDHDAHRESRLGQLKAQMKLKRGGVSLRKLLEATGDVVQAIKPCFMMSPISVAQYLAPGAMEFDVVIFDEASQVEPADAFGAVARGGQLLLIGDDKQLPPTNFFNRAHGDESAEVVDVAAAEQESILDVGRNALPETSVCSLRWHYRSLHQSLITFSNQRFYDNKLRVFPSPHADRSELGLVLRHVANGIYLRGEGQYNPEEAREVVRAVIEHARSSPRVSLGVGAFSTAQQKAIEDELERVRRRLDSEELEKFFSPASPEPFFVKNLETIQGDERDVVLLSVGYGRDRGGNLTMNFGPLNREGGWRRLNVLITRARRRCEVFSSIRHDEIRVPGEGARGVAALKEYLRVAEQGATDAHQPSPQAEVQNARLEETIARALEQRGYAAHVRVGAAGFHVDVAVVDPDRPGRYVLGVECDGETYVGAATARDRDRLRMEVLVGLGWNVARIWAADWFRRPGLMLDQLAQTIEELRRAPRRDSEPRVLEVEAEVAAEVVAQPQALPPSEEEDEDLERVTLNGTAPSGLVPYTSPPARALGDLETLLELADAAVLELVREVVEAEAPVHEEQVAKVISSWFGTKAAARARAKVRAAIFAGCRRDLFERRDQFLWRPGASAPSVRFRGGDCPVTRPDHIPLEEFAQAALLVLEREYGLPRASMVQATLRLLGFRRAGAKLVQAAEQGIDWLIINGRIRHDERGGLQIAKSSAAPAP